MELTINQKSLISINKSLFNINFVGFNNISNKMIIIRNIRQINATLGNNYYNFAALVDKIGHYKLKSPCIIYFNAKIVDFNMDMTVPVIDGTDVLGMPEISIVPHGKFAIYKDVLLNLKDSNGNFNNGCLDGYYYEYRGSDNWLKIIKYYSNNRLEYVRTYTKRGFILPRRSFSFANTSRKARNILKMKPYKRNYRNYTLPDHKITEGKPKKVKIHI